MRGWPAREHKLCVQANRFVQQIMQITLLVGQVFIIIGFGIFYNIRIILVS